MSSETVTHSAPAADAALSTKNSISPPVNAKELTKQDNRIKRPEQKEIERIAEISLKVRQGVRASLPTPPEQFFTIMAPGKVLNLDDYIAKEKTLLTPRFIQLAEAILCDDMPALSAVQLGPTGRSVSRSYGATLSKLCPAGSTTGIDDNPKEKLSEQAIRYRKAMDWLTCCVNHYGRMVSRIDLYREKQNAYTKAFEDKTRAFRSALEWAKDDPRNVTNEQKRAAYDTWVSENQKSWRNMCQAAYMDWVTNGKKEETEYWFSIVDNDSAMSRVEASKEAMRNSVISDEDGAVEYQKVKLTPSNWASLAKEKAYASSTADALKWNITRLSKINAVIRGMLAGREDSTVGLVAKDTGDDLKKVQDAALSYVRALKEQLKPGSAAVSKEVVSNKRDLLRKALEVSEQSDEATANVEKLYYAKQTDLEFQYKTNANLIAEYQNQLDGINGSNSIDALQGLICKELNISPAAPVTPVKTSADFWTQVKVRIDRSESGDRTEVTSSSSDHQDTSYSTFGLWSVGGSYSKDSATSGVIKELSSTSLEITFDCMRVDIHRSWLRGELFYDHDLKPAPGPANYISPGPVTLATLLDAENYEPPVTENGEKMTREQFLERYHLFPMYPTAFLLAANITLKLDSQSDTIKNYFDKNSSSYSRHNESINYGPFCIRTSNEESSSGASKSEVADSQCIATGSGLEIRIKSPQVIGTVSQMLPTLPRPNQQ
ncbi:hypothetical protein BDQ17DRAFT_1323151 [Cyathus striatus]|nr:hypothetical protein BDQ17DRAFT_1323151 [Cyathus striatus]